MNDFILKNGNIIRANAVLFEMDIKICDGKIADIGNFASDGEKPDRCRYLSC